MSNREYESRLFEGGEIKKGDQVTAFSLVFDLMKGYKKKMECKQAFITPLINLTT